MPHYRITIKQEKEAVKEYIIEDGCKEIDLVYNNYKRRVYAKNGAGRVIYFDLVMISEESLKHLEDRKEVFHENNSFGLDNITVVNKSNNWRKTEGPKPTLGERVRK
jgi:hypothetical protein